MLKAGLPPLSLCLMEMQQLVWSLIWSVIAGPRPQFCIQSDGGEVLMVLRSWRNCFLDDASQSFPFKRCHDILGTFWSLLRGT